MGIVLLMGICCAWKIFQSYLNLADETKAVQVVKHDYKTKYPVKYLGAKNEDYRKELVSSVILFNCGHPANRTLTKRVH